MKTERMTLLVTPAEKARINAESAKLGVSASEYVRRLLGLLDAEDIAELENLAALMPALTAAMTNIEANISRTISHFEAAEKERLYMRTDAYRDQVREELLADSTTNWAAVKALFGRGHGSAVEAAE